MKYGSVVAAPYVSNLLTSILPYLDYNSTRESSEHSIDNYIGIDIKSATDNLKKNGINYVVVGNGNTVIDQIPSADVSILKSVSTVYLYTEMRDEEYTVVPSVVGLSIKEANLLLSGLGLNVRISGGLSDGCTTISVTSQSLPLGARVKKGSVIALTVLGTDFED